MKPLTCCSLDNNAQSIPACQDPRALLPISTDVSFFLMFQKILMPISFSFSPDWEQWGSCRLTCDEH